MKALFLALIVATSMSAFAADSCSVKPPAGAQLAIVEFEDLQCPRCAAVTTTIHDAARVYKIPLVRYDFPLPIHNWTKQASIIGKYFDHLSAQPGAKDKTLGDEYRAYIFANQPAITPDGLRSYAETFAKSKGVTLPANVDPNGEFEKEVNLNYACGVSNHIQHTPTIYLVKNDGSAPVEVQDVDKLYATIDTMLPKTAPKSAATPKKKTVAKKSVAQK
jgi:thioredoxin family protein